MACTFKDGVWLAGSAFGFGKRAQGRFSRNYHGSFFCGRRRFALHKRDLKAFWIALTVPVVLMSISTRMDAAYIGSDGVPVSERAVSSWTRMSDGYRGASLYLDRGWYYFLDKGQYDYLERGQYNLMNGLNFVLGHPAYPRLFERVACGGIGFESWGHVGFFGILDGFGILGRGDERADKAVGSEGYRMAFVSYGAGDYIDRRWYLIIDREQYYYLDLTQYLLNGGLGYLFGRFSVDLLYDSSVHGRGAFGGDECNPGSNTRIPEPSTIAVLSLGCLCLTRFWGMRSAGGRS